MIVAITLRQLQARPCPESRWRVFVGQHPLVYILPGFCVRLEPLAHVLDLRSNFENPFDSLLRPQEVALILSYNLLYERLQPFWRIFSMPGGICASQQCFEERIELRSVILVGVGQAIFYNRE